MFANLNINTNIQRTEKNLKSRYIREERDSGRSRKDKNRNYEREKRRKREVCFLSFLILKKFQEDPGSEQEQTEEIELNDRDRLS